MAWARVAVAKGLAGGAVAWERAEEEEAEAAEEVEAEEGQVMLSRVEVALAVVVARAASEAAAGTEGAAAAAASIRRTRRTKGCRTRRAAHARRLRASECTAASRRLGSGSHRADRLCQNGIRTCARLQRVWIL